MVESTETGFESAFELTGDPVPQRVAAAAPTLYDLESTDFDSLHSVIDPSALDYATEGVKRERQLQNQRHQSDEFISVVSHAPRRPLNIGGDSAL